MAIFRVNKTSNYTVMSNHHLQDKNLSLKAKGLLSWMLSLPEDWDYSVNGIVACHKEGEDAIKSALSELKTYGYLIVSKLKPESYIDDNGDKVIIRKQIEYEYNVYEQPMYFQDTENQATGFQSLDFQDTENPTQINTKEQNTNIPNTYNKAQAGPASVEISSKRNFRRNKEILSDDLASAKDIVSQTKKQKEKAPIDVQCLDEIERDSYGFDKETKQMLAQYIQFVTATGDSRRVKDLKLWRKKLTSLLELSHNDNIVMRKIIKQSLDNKWYKFVEYEEHTTQSRTNVPTVDNLIHQSQRGEDIIAQRIARGIKAY